MTVVVASHVVAVFWEGQLNRLGAREKRKAFNRFGNCVLAYIITRAHCLASVLQGVSALASGSQIPQDREVQSEAIQHPERGLVVKCACRRVILPFGGRGDKPEVLCCRNYARTRMCMCFSKLSRNSDLRDPGFSRCQLRVVVASPTPEYTNSPGPDEAVSNAERHHRHYYELSLSPSPISFNVAG